MKIFKVGGYVRDKLLGIPPKDCDYVVIGATIQKMLELGFIQVGKSFPVFLHPITHEEYALARSEKKSGYGYHGFDIDTSPEISLEEDLSRRDLTINAIAEDETGNIIDPYGGISDLRLRKLRHVSSAFKDDPLRILRIARFAATLNFSVAEETMHLLLQMAETKEGQYIARERIVHELKLALAGNYSQNFFDVLAKSNNLAVFFPGLENINNDFCSIIANTTDILQKYTLLAINLPHIESVITQVALESKLKEYLKYTQTIYHKLDINLDETGILQILKMTHAPRNLDNFKTIVDNLIWYVEIIKGKSSAPPWLYCMNNIANALAAIPTHELINKSMDKHDIIKVITHWQLQTIQQIRDCKC